MLYLDSSALAKLYLDEPESRAVSELVKNHEPGLFTSRLTYTELISVLSRGSLLPQPVAWGMMSAVR